jgi:dienelactone hydrolase
MTKPRRLGFLLLGLAACVGLAACAPKARAVKPALTADDKGTIRFSTAESIVLSGDLALPSGKGPFPAVILMHGCAGLPHQAINGWQPALRSWDYATFVVDSFGGRGLREVCTNARTLSGTQRIQDAYAALKILATHPRIDKDRIVLMGFSHGGIAALRSATAWARERYAPTGPAFRAFIPFYPYCNSVFPEMMRITAPLRIHTGELDDWTPAKPCEDLVRSLHAAGANAQITIYAGAAHAFDGPGTPLTSLPNVDNAAACTPRQETISGPILNESEFPRCLRKGATVGHHPGATGEARKIVRAQLAELLQ